MSSPILIPKLLLVHGAWHRKGMWTRLIGELTKQRPNLIVSAIQLPSSAPVPTNQLGDLYDDAAAIRAAVDEIDGPVVVMAHSYGGAPTSQALVNAANVRRIIYLCAFQLDTGESMESTLGGRPYFWGVTDGGYYNMLDAEKIFYSDLPPEAAAEAAAMLGPHSEAAMSQPLTQAAWHSIDSTYIFADNDVHPEAFAGFSKRSKRIRHINSAHSPFLSKPKELAQIALDELDEVARRE
jgi:pimeloyl-ACP methyl ester carboxylesterase